MTKKTISIVTAISMILLLFIGCSDTAKDTPVSATDISQTDAVISTSDAVIVPFDTTAPLFDTSSPLTASQTAEIMGLGWNLGNTMEAYWLNESNITAGSTIIGENTPQNYETCWGSVVTTKECIEGIKKAGFDTVRIPVYWGNMMNDDGTYTISTEYIDRVKEIVGYCHDYNLITIINIHHFDGYIINRNSLEDSERIFKILWTQIAEAFKDHPYDLLFEGYNESLGSGRFNDNGEIEALSREDAYKMTNSLNQIFVDAVRSTGGNNAERVLIISGYNTNIDLTTAADFIIPTDTVDDRLMVSVHYVDNAMYWTNRIGDKNWLTYIENQCKLLESAFSDKGIPVFIGETTSVYSDDRFSKSAVHTTSSECLEIVLRKLLDYGFVPVLWDVSDNFYSRTDCVIKTDSDRAVIAAVADDIKGN